MKFGEIIDYMMENEIVSTIKTNDGKIIITGEMHGHHPDIPNSNSLYMLTITHDTGAIIYKVLELSKPNWEDVNYSTEIQIRPEKNIIIYLIYMKMCSDILERVLRNLIVLQTSVKGANIIMRIS